MNCVGPPCKTQLKLQHTDSIFCEFAFCGLFWERDDGKTKYTLCRTASVTGQEIYIIPLSTSTAYLR